MEFASYTFELPEVEKALRDYKVWHTRHGKACDDEVIY